MAKQRLHLTFPEALIQEPVIYNLSRKHEVVTNIRRANVEEKVGWVILEVSGTEEAIAGGVRYLEGLGVQVNRIDGEMLEG